jgi:L-amino acid N-acyltransferase YncA
MLQIRPTKASDVDEIWSVLDEVSRERVYMALLKGPDIEKFRLFVRNNFKLNYPQFHAMYNNKIVGWCDVSSFHRDIFIHCGSLGMGILSGFRGKGIGSALLEAAIAKSREIGLTRLELAVREYNKAALGLYLKHGFVIEGVKRNGVRIDSVYEDLIFMGLLLDS